MDDYIIYSEGICHMSICVPADATKGRIETFANRNSPTGIHSRWEITEPTFADGKPNPIPCNREPDRMHYLLTC